MLESEFQRKVRKRILAQFPDAIVFKTDERQIQGFPDLLFLIGSSWGCLEVKKSEKAARRPNQEYWVERLSYLSYAEFIYPENEEEIFDELDRIFGS